MKLSNGIIVAVMLFASLPIGCMHVTGPANADNDTSGSDSATESNENEPSGSDSATDSSLNNSTDIHDSDTLTGNIDTSTGPDEGIDVDCSSCGPFGEDGLGMWCAIDVCDLSFIESSSITSPFAFDQACLLEEAYAVIDHFGDPANGLAPKKNSNYAILSTGRILASDTVHSDWCTQGLVPDTDSYPGYTDTAVPTLSIEDPWSPGVSMFDMVEWTLTLTAPLEANGFSIKYVFLSSEYDDFVASQYTDKFYILLNAPITTGGRTLPINYAGCRNPEDYTDFTGDDCDHPSGSCCFISVNSEHSECCWYPENSPFSANHNDEACYGVSPSDNLDISGTGFECAGNAFLDDSASGSSTKWMSSAWIISPGETFTLTFQIYDANDGLYDSAVILDDFQFHNKVEAGFPLTVPVPL